ncbi:outer dynein arm-docking complex subunit 3-like [Glandiceps talaboti]
MPWVTKGWTIQDHIEEFRSKIALKDRDHRAYFDSAEVATRQNEDHILRLRRECKEKRVELSNSNNGDEKVIKTVFAQRQRECLSLQRKTATQAIAAMDQKVCEKAKLLNLLVHRNQQKEQRLADLKNMYQRDRKLYSVSTASHERDSDQRIRKLENSLDKAMIKISTALKIQENYREILSCLEKESHIFPDHVRSLEDALEEQRTELEELREINADSQAGREMTRGMLTKLEHEVLAARRQRDKTLIAKKKQAEKQKDTADKTEKRQLRATLQNLDDMNADPRLQSRLAQENLMKIADYEEDMRRINDAHSTSQVEDILHRILDQQAKSKQLIGETCVLAKRLKLLKEEKIRLHKQYEDLKYTGERQSALGQSLISRMENHLQREIERYGEKSRTFEKKEKVLVESITGIESLYEKTKSVRLPPPSRSFATDGDIMDKLNLVEMKLVNILNLLQLADKTTVKQALAGQDFQDFMENTLPPENVRICIEEEDDYVTNELDYDSQDNEETLSRQDIKRQGQNLVEKKIRKRGRKRKS